MKKILVLIGAWALAGCAAQQQRAVNDAYVSGQLAKSEAVKACARSQRVASCMLGVAVAFGGGNSDSLPVVQSDLSAVLNSSLLGTVAGVVGQVKQSNNARDVAIAQTGASVAIAQSSDAREVGVMQATTRSSERIATAGFDATAAAARAASEAAQAAALAQAQAAQAQADAIAALPPTTQTIAGGSVTQAGGAVDQSVNGANRVTGNNNETARNILCAANGGNASATLGGLTASTAGATSALNPGYNPIISIVPAPTSNNCGGG